MLLKQLIPSDKLYVLAITSSFASSTLSYLSLDISTGEASPLTHIPSSIVEPSHAHLLDQPPRAVWLEDGHGRRRRMGESSKLLWTKSNRLSFPEIIEVLRMWEFGVRGISLDGGVTEA